MAASTSGGIDPRFPEAFQRGGSSDDLVDAPRAVASRPQTPREAAPLLDENATVRAAIVRPGVTGEPDETHFEIIVAGNPWLRALWIVGGITMAVGIALTVYAEYAFSVPPSSGIYDPSVYIVPRVADAVAQPLVIAGVIALVSAAALRIVAWRPSGARAVTGD